MSEHFDVLVVGAGPAGIAAAVSASASGKRVGLVDDNPTPGGQIWRSGTPAGAEARKWFAKLDDAPVIRLQGWRVFDHPEPGILRAECNQECRDLRFGKLILATGARELLSAVSGMDVAECDGCGRIGRDGSGWTADCRETRSGRRNRSVVAGCRGTSSPPWREDRRPLRTSSVAPIHSLCGTSAERTCQACCRGSATSRRHVARGSTPAAGRLRRPAAEKLESVTLQRSGKNWDVRCDYLACGFHLVPNLEMAALLGCRIEDGFVATDDLQRTSVADVFCAGEPTGIGGVDLALLEGTDSRTGGRGQNGRSGEVGYGIEVGGSDLFGLLRMLLHWIHN